MHQTLESGSQVPWDDWALVQRNSINHKFSSLLNCDLYQDFHTHYLHLLTLTKKKVPVTVVILIYTTIRIFIIIHLINHLYIYIRIRIIHIYIHILYQYNLIKLGPSSLYPLRSTSTLSHYLDPPTAATIYKSSTSFSRAFRPDGLVVKQMPPKGHSNTWKTKTADILRWQKKSNLKKTNIFGKKSCAFFGFFGENKLNKRKGRAAVEMEWPQCTSTTSKRPVTWGVVTLHA